LKLNANPPALVDSFPGEILREGIAGAAREKDEAREDGSSAHWALRVVPES
jgi:hypothetical protein